MSKFETNAITWFEIPTTDFERATKFYETVLDTELRVFPGPEPCNMFVSGGPARSPRPTARSST
jgi:predicted enzyme related to lactoylglutathione lyase